MNAAAALLLTFVYSTPKLNPNPEQVGHPSVVAVALSHEQPRLSRLQRCYHRDKQDRHP